jgi:aryl-alcohol dehydrogenase
VPHFFVKNCKISKGAVQVMKISAAVVNEKAGPFQITELEMEEPRADEVLIRIVASGVCHTDLIIRDQYIPVPLPLVLGHEGSGIVEKVGERVTKVQPGDHVVMSFAACNNCPSCKSGKAAYCYNFFPSNFSGARPDGSTYYKQGDKSVHGHFFGQSSFATYALATEQNVVKVRKDVPLELLGPLGCGVQTGAGAVLNTLHPHAGTSIAIFGIGSVGLSAVMGARIAGCTTIIAVDINSDRLALSRELGATHTINGAQMNAVEEIQKITGGGVNYSLEATASPKVFRQAVDALTIQGTCGLIGAAPMGTEVTFDMSMILSLGRRIQGVVEGDSVADIFIPRLIDLYLQGNFPFDRLITFYPFEQANQAAEDSEKGKVIKPVLRMPS